MAEYLNDLAGADKFGVVNDNIEKYYHDISAFYNSTPFCFNKAFAVSTESTPVLFLIGANSFSQRKIKFGEKQ